jgi:hypothetical protein
MYESASEALACFAPLRKKRGKLHHESGCAFQMGSTEEELGEF